MNEGASGGGGAGTVIALGLVFVVVVIMAFFLPEAKQSEAQRAEQARIEAARAEAEARAAIEVARIQAETERFKIHSDALAAEATRGLIVIVVMGAAIFLTFGGAVWFLSRPSAGPVRRNTDRAYILGPDGGIVGFVEGGATYLLQAPQGYPQAPQIAQAPQEYPQAPPAQYGPYAGQPIPAPRPQPRGDFEIPADFRSGGAR